MKPATLAFLLCTVFGAPSAIAMPTVAEFHHQTMDYFAEVSEGLFSSSEEGHELWEQILSEGDRVRVEQIRDYAARYLANNPASEEFSEIKAQADKILQKNEMLTEELAYKNAIGSGQAAYGNDEQVDAIDIASLDPAKVDLSNAETYDVPTPDLASKANNELTTVSKIYENFETTTQPLMDECAADQMAFMSRHYGQYVSRPCMQERLEALSGFGQLRQMMTRSERIYFTLFSGGKLLETARADERPLLEQYIREMVAIQIEDLKRAEKYGLQ